jgi:hypothetical protein
VRLNDARAKVSQAEDHAARFRRLEIEFADQLGPPAEAVVAMDGSTVYKRRALPDPPPEFSLVAGDCLQNARAALDHAVYDPFRRRQTQSLSRLTIRDAAFSTFRGHINAL